MNTSGQIHPMENEATANYNEGRAMGFPFIFVFINLEIQRPSLENPLSEIHSSTLIPSEIPSQVPSIPSASGLGSIENPLRAETQYRIISQTLEL